MKKILFAVVCILFLFTGCSECIGITQEEIPVVIVDTYYRPLWRQPINAGKVTTYVTHPAEYRIYVTLNGENYAISDHSLYSQYKDQIGMTAIGVFEIREYENGSMRTCLIDIKPEVV